jgi:hypothetical protein
MHASLVLTLKPIFYYQALLDVYKYMLCPLHLQYATCEESTTQTRDKHMYVCHCGTSINPQVFPGQPVAASWSDILLVASFLLQPGEQHTNKDLDGEWLAGWVAQPNSGKPGCCQVQ